LFLRIRARRGHQVAAVAVARKLTMLCWHLLTKDPDYQWARPALVAHKIRAIASDQNAAGGLQVCAITNARFWVKRTLLERTATSGFDRAASIADS
jgi:hypothetical protein